MRTNNEIDFWRGFALVTIFVNHVPGLVYERLTYRNFSLSDSAELFVFLAGWSLRYVVNAGGASVPPGALVFRLSGRALSIYAAQMLITLVALALIAAAALVLDAPLLLEWHNAAAVFQDPVEAHVGLALLSHQLGYFNILPLYVVLMILAPAAALLDRVSPWLLLGVSGFVWLFALVFAVNLPTWPVEGRWFFNPLSWQLIFVLGFLAARLDGPRLAITEHMARWRWIAWPIVISGALTALFNWSPDPLRVPEPRLFFTFDKTFLAPARLMHFLALAVVVAGVYQRLPRWLGPLDRYFSALGRNSLNVFCVASVLSLAAQITRFVQGSGIGTDTFVLMTGLVAMGWTAWVSEWRDRS